MVLHWDSLFRQPNLVFVANWRTAQMAWSIAEKSSVREFFKRDFVSFSSLLKFGPRFQLLSQVGWLNVWIQKFAPRSFVFEDFTEITQEDDDVFFLVNGLGKQKTAP